MYRTWKAWTELFCPRAISALSPVHLPHYILYPSPFILSSFTPPRPDFLAHALALISKWIHIHHLTSLFAKLIASWNEFGVKRKLCEKGSKTPFSGVSKLFAFFRWGVWCLGFSFWIKFLFEFEVWWIPVLNILLGSTTSQNGTNMKI